jgi:hypothetical protein
MTSNQLEFELKLTRRLDLVLVLGLLLRAELCWVDESAPMSSDST